MSTVNEALSRASRLDHPPRVWVADLPDDTARIKLLSHRAQSGYRRADGYVASAAPRIVRWWSTGGCHSIGEWGDQRDQAGFTHLVSTLLHGFDDALLSRAAEAEEFADVLYSLPREAQAEQAHRQKEAPGPLSLDRTVQMTPYGALMAVDRSGRGGYDGCVLDQLSQWLTDQLPDTPEAWTLLASIGENTDESVEDLTFAVQQILT